LKLLHKGLILVLVPLALQLVFVVTLWQLLTQADYQTRRLSHAKEVTLQINVLMQDFIDAGRAGGLYKLSKAETFRTQVIEKLRSIITDLDLLETLTQADPAEHAAFQKVKPVVADLTVLLEDSLRKVDKRELLPQIEVRNLTQQFSEQAGRLHTAMGELSSIEKEVEATAPVEEAQSRERLMLWISSGLLLDVLVAVGLAIFFNKQLLGKLGLMIDNTRRLTRNEPLHPVNTGTDEIAHLDKTFHEMAQALHEAAQYKKELVAMVSHDLRTPLTSIQASLSLLEVGACGEIPAKALQQVELAERSSTRLINLINDLLDVEKMEAGKLEMHIVDADSLDIIYRAVEAVGSFAEEHQIQFNLPKAGHPIAADPERLIQVLVNLLSNAIKFSPDGSTITVEAREEAGFTEFRVSDQGPGIPAEYIDKLFERFKQIEGITSTKVKGTGLGLTICKAIVQGHGGEIGVQSKVGQGSTFWFRIPKQDSAGIVRLQGDSQLHRPS
jgi:signal transduction histidine kinase